eukprot:TRINITY_DN1720_c0_g1_i1.p1 TRINITY_DN1720_c0_g1~~TRINITY_DN1720_c0_g1_i1.p1  ORF type:complete len:509 (-),score=146.66 TRINITY_DN1720_c0_g1_i1:201-1673(-)
MPENPEIWKAVAMADHFEKIQKLPDPVAGCPNFRRVPGYKVYLCGQPTVAGFEACLSKVCGTIYPKDGKIIWFNLRQEPSIYINGEPACARPPNKIGEYAELGNVSREKLKEDEAEFVRVCEGRMKETDGKLKTVDVNKAEKEVEVKSIVTLHDVVEGVKEKFPGLVHMRIPICNSASPLESDFDILVKTLIGSNINTPVIINDQVGLSRATTGCVAACLFKEFQISASFEGLVETVPGVNLDLLKMDRYKMDPNKDALFRGEFEVIKELVAELKDEGAKNECDKVIDKNGPAKTGGTGIKQLRENIAESKLSYEIMDDAAQAFLKTKIQDNITKYYMLIVFSGYLRDDKVPDPNTPEEDIKMSKKFAEYMKDNGEMAIMIQKGKGKLQWERDIPADVLTRLENLSKSDFFGNMGTIIHDILGAANKIFRDMADVGDHKKRAKYRFSSKTLMTVLPVDLQNMIDAKIEAGDITMDFYEILGEVQKKKPAE